MEWNKNKTKTCIDIDAHRSHFDQYGLAQEKILIIPKKPLRVFTPPEFQTFSMWIQETVFHWRQASPCYLECASTSLLEVVTIAILENNVPSPSAMSQSRQHNIVKAEYILRSPKFRFSALCIFTSWTTNAQYKIENKRSHYPLCKKWDIDSMDLPALHNAQKWELA